MIHAKQVVQQLNGCMLTRSLMGTSTYMSHTA